jgi:hypothetical protein
MIVVVDAGDKVVKACGMREVVVVVSGRDSSDACSILQKTKY